MHLIFVSVHRGRTLNCLPKADELFTVTDWLASLWLNPQNWIVSQAYHCSLLCGIHLHIVTIEILLFGIKKHHLHGGRQRAWLCICHRQWWACMLEQHLGMASAAQTLKGFGTPLNTQTGCHTCFETRRQLNNLPNFEAGMAIPSSFKITRFWKMGNLADAGFKTKATEWAFNLPNNPWPWAALLKESDFLWERSG